MFLTKEIYLYFPYMPILYTERPQCVYSGTLYMNSYQEIL